LSLGVPYVSSSASILTEAIKSENYRRITRCLARSVHCPSLSCVLSCSEGDIVDSRLRLTAPSCFRSNTSSHPETISQGRQMSREGEGLVRVVDCPSGPPACFLNRGWTAVVLSPSVLNVIWEYYHKSLPPLAEINSFCRLRTIRSSHITSYM
jgi:hypothetical protein